MPDQDNLASKINSLFVLKKLRPKQEWDTLSISANFHYWIVVTNATQYVATASERCVLLTEELVYTVQLTVQPAAAQQLCVWHQCLKQTERYDNSWNHWDANPKHMTWLNPLASLAVLSQQCLQWWIWHLDIKLSLDAFWLSSDTATRPGH